MTSSHCGEESSIASLSPPFSLKSGTLEFPNASDTIDLEIIPAPESTLPNIESSSSTHTSTVLTHSVYSTLKKCHSPTPLPTNLHVTIHKVIYTVPPKKQYDLLEDAVYITSGFLPPTLHPVKNILKSKQ